MDLAHLVQPAGDAGFVNLWRQLRRSPAVHFLLVGALLIVADGARSRLGASFGSRSIVLTSSDVRQLRRGFQQQYGRSPTVAEEWSLIERAVDEEVLYRRAIEIGLDRGNRVIRERLVATMRLLADDPKKDADALYREALALGLDKKDIVVRRHLVQLMTLLLKRAAAKLEITQADLEHELERDADRYRIPGLLTLTQIYFDRGKRGDHAGPDAERMLAEIRSHPVAAAGAPALGDPFLLGARFTRRSETDIRKLFGDRFADAAARAAPGKWSGPIDSVYGAHLLLVEDRVPGRLPAIGSVRNQLVGRLLEERGEEVLKAKLAEMRARYAITIGPSVGDEVLTATAEGGTVLPAPRPARELGD